MRRIFVSGASGIVGYGILRSLRNTSQDLFLVGSSIYGDSVAPAFCDTFEQAPHTDSVDYIDWLIEVIKRHHIDMLIPGIEIDMNAWAQHSSRIQRTGAVALLNSPSLIELCQDKWKFYLELKKLMLPCAIESTLQADFDELEQRFKLPFLLKPRQGFGSKGIVRVDGLEAFLPHRSKIGSILMVQPIVGTDNDEYTTSVFCDHRSKVLAGMTLRRTLSSSGFTEKAEVVDSTIFSSIINGLCQNFRPVGPTNFQFRMCKEGPKLLEINPRISSSTSIRTAFGYNESAMAVDYFLDNKLPARPAVRSGRAVRYIDEQIFYEDSLYFRHPW